MTSPRKRTHLRRDAAGAGLIVVLTVSLAACSSGGESAEDRPVQRNIVPKVLVSVVDADRGTPVGGARVKGLGRPVEGRTDANGLLELVGPVGPVRVSAPRYGPRTVGTGRALTEVVIRDNRLQSPQYGGGPRRTRHHASVSVGPPRGRPVWTFDARTLVEFPPVVADGVLAFGTNGGRVFALDPNTGKVRWDDKLAGAIASSPSIIGGIVYVTSMDGTLTAYRARDGQRLWRRSTGSPIESSPLVVAGLIYVGDWSGRVYAIDARRGGIRWSFQTPGQIKGSAAASGRNVVIGDYSGRVHALDRRTGAKRWTFAGGTRFYGGPGIADGRVVIGDIGGAVYALDADSGRQLWRHSTGGAYVYSSPAIAHGRAFIGSYNGRFQALDLRSGRVRWSYDIGGRISGSAAIVNGVAYASRLYAPGEPRRTVGLRISDGSLVYDGDDGRYSPAVGAGNHLYLVGTRKVYAYEA